ncbi:MAG: hypothetical protein WBQ69_10195 [Gallionella sp.]
MSPPQLDLRVIRMLLADWFARLAREAGLKLDQYGTGGKGYTLGAPSEFNVTAKFIEERPFLQFLASDANLQELVNKIAQQAVTRVDAGDYGSITWYSVSLATECASPFSMGTFVQQLGSQTRIVGWRRLGSDILIEFTEELPVDLEKKNTPFAPKAVAHIHIAVPSPCAGHFSSYIAHSATETVAAICTFALGRPINLPPSVFPTSPERLPDLNSRRTDTTVLTLARKHVSLDFFSQVVVSGGLEHFARMRAAFLTFDAAIQQQHDSVACILYVVAAEVLSTPNSAWRDTKLTKRFIDFFTELMPSTLDQIVAHGNFEGAFGISRGTRTSLALRRELLEQIYDFRSGHLHAGLRPSYRGIFFGLDESSDEIRRILIADFAEGAILGYLASPRSSLIGYPKFS